MRKILVSNLRPGMALAQDILTENGAIMLRRGVALTAHFAEALKARGFSVIPVLDGIADDVEPPEVLSQQVRMATTKHLHDLFSLGARLSVDRGSLSPRGGGRSATVVGSASHAASLSRDVEAIVEEVLSAEVVDGIISLKSYDNYTFEHSIEVTIISVMLGKFLHLSSDHLFQLALGAVLHDIGKVFVPESILNKPGRLTPEEFDLIKSHPADGYDLVGRVFPHSNILARHVVYQHHERQDGTGYPRGLRGHNSLPDQRSKRYTDPGEMLPIAEISALADVYSALASDRPYRPAMPNDKIADLMQEMAGNHLNRAVLACFLSICPVYPVGSDVVFTAGELRGYRGVVTAVNSKNIERPVVRVVFDPAGNQVTPFEFDTGADDKVQLKQSQGETCFDPCH